MSEAIQTAAENAETIPPGDEATFTRLAALGRIAYDRCREEEAKKLGIRIGTLDTEVEERRPASSDNGPATMFEDPVPWSEEVDGDDLLMGLCQAFRRFLALPDGAAEVMALWTLHAHAHDAAYVSPFLVFSSPEKRCGKTTALLMVYRLVPRPVMASSITPSVLFRVIDRHQPCILIDEAENVIKGDSDELRGLLNAGHTRATAVS